MKPHPLKVARDERGWSQSKLAKTMGVTTKTVIRWETQQALPRLHHREQLSRLFGKTMGELGLISDMDTKDDSQEAESPVEQSFELESSEQEVLPEAESPVGQSFEPESSEQEVLPDNPAMAEGLAAQQWLTNSLVGNLQARERKIQADEDHSPAPGPVAPREEKTIFQSRSHSSWRSRLLISIILLTVLAIIAVTLASSHKLSFLKLGQPQTPSSSTSTKVDGHFSLPSYTLTVENTDPTLSNPIKHLQQAFNAVYPQLVNRFALNPASAQFHTVTLTFLPNRHLAATAHGMVIPISADWIKQHPTEVGVLTHELTLAIEQYPASTPGWFADGMADYARSVYGPADDDWSLPNDVQPQDSYQQGGAITARFLLWLEQHSGFDSVDQLNHALQTGQSFADAFSRLTQHTIDELWSQYQAQPALTQTPEQLYKTVTSRKPLYQSSFDVQDQISSNAFIKHNLSKSIMIPKLNMSNFAMQADMTVSSGDGQAGFVFRNQNAVSYNLFLGLDRTYSLSFARQYPGFDGQLHLLTSGFSSVIKEGLHQTNQVAIVAQKHSIYIYINGHFITQVEDSGSSYGVLGVVALSSAKTTDVRFDNVEIF